MTDAFEGVVPTNGPDADDDGDNDYDAVEGVVPAKGPEAGHPDLQANTDGAEAQQLLHGARPHKQPGKSSGETSRRYSYRNGQAAVCIQEE